ncbi:MAG: YiiD C-terminal domain-containing protein [Pseudomonadota bacterium]
MQPTELERYLHDHIPLSRAMGVTVLAVDEHGVTLQAPLAPNINHRETVFGGSASALAILAAWSLVHTRMLREGLAGRLVIQRNSMDYDQAIEGDFSARARLEHPGEWPRFTQMLARKGKARVSVAAMLEHDGTPVGRFTGEFVALA